MQKLYTWFAVIGFGSVAASLMVGFRHDPAAPAVNYLLNAGLFLAYMVVHYVMMTPGFKKLVSSNPAGSPAERRLYMVVAIASWIAVYLIHYPMPGPALAFPGWVTFLGGCAFMMSFLAFTEGTTFEGIRAFAGVPGHEQTHGASAEAPLQTEGSYASVRHPMYRGACYMGLTSLLLHPNAAQLAWAGIMGLTFLTFIPIEEKQLLKGRGDEYREYMKQTPYRIFRGVW